ncbi:hypothetical protein BDW59DRAFT_147079 [Aspergillus cavernicola]|uniref:F-box domain-containing protein n=1 Tax=Aspergillus cavernicola TaxID=176166 RepID=A0ABR4IAJ7_9EURO
MGSRGEAALLQRQGQNLYGQGSWEAAVNAFTEALKCPDIDALSVLDNRAATYTKLLRYDQALKDARQMIKRNKQDERGYLRCAKALLLDGKPEKALEVYAYALKTLPKDNSRRPVVEQMHKKLQNKLGSRNLDPFSVFPLEIARMVLDHFEFRQIVAILRVSKGWDRFLSSMRDLWMRLDFSGARSKIHWSSSLAYIRRSKAMLTQAVVTNLTKASIRKVLEYVSRCPRLEHLEILSPFGSEGIYELFKGCKQLKVLLVSAETPVPQSTITKLLASLPKLERIEIHKATKSLQSDTQWPSSLPNLQSITLGTTESGLFNHVPALYIPRLVDPSTPFPLSNLTELRLHSNPQVFVPYPPSFNPLDFPHLQKLDMSGLYIGGDFGLPPSLQFLRIRGGAAIEALPFASATEDQPLHLPNLTTLIFSDVPWATYDTLYSFLVDAKAPVSVLHVDSCLRVMAEMLIRILCEHDSRISTLNVAHIMGIDDMALPRLFGGVRTLKVLNLSYTDITGVTIKTLVDSRIADDKANVECVYVKGCEGISSDAIEYGRSRGLVIVT